MSQDWHRQIQRNNSIWKPKLLILKISLKNCGNIEHLWVQFLGDTLYTNLKHKLKSPTTTYSTRSHELHVLKQVVKGCGMGTLFVLVSPCFRENVVVTCKIGSFSCRLDNLLQKNVIYFFFGNQISKWRSFEKKNGYFLATFHIF